MKVGLIYYNFLDANGVKRLLGGVQTYLWNLSKLISDRGDEPILFQSAAQSFDHKIEHLRVIGVPRVAGRIRSNIRNDLYHQALSVVGGRQGLVIFGADNVSVSTNYPRTISIQHGIGWDLPGRFLTGIFHNVPMLSEWLGKRYNAYRGRLYFENCINRVCVDYNFLNWYRTQLTDVPKGNIWVIPNFANVPSDYQPDYDRHESGNVKIIFARRFIEYRGSRLMVEVSKNLLEKFQEIEICFAGEGPDEQLIAEAFISEPRVSIRKYMPDESLCFHGKYHIAVVPSLASEGTSLSLLEAMASGCAVVATNVGGMTNIIVDRYNGRLVHPDVEQLTEAICELVASSSERLILSKRAADMTRNAFSLELWRARWSVILDQFSNSDN